FTALGVTIAIPDSRIEVENPVVDVAIEIGEKRSPATAPLSSTSVFGDHLIAAKVRASTARSAHQIQ
ncbi:MAG TPA: hypothetical protein VFH15_03210, partial [Pyrinomonadaceae bacterium]|nr:hypothetical protein [Pyrinomonadaceae bacterium]